MVMLADDHRDKIDRIMAASPLIPVIRIEDPQQALPLCHALVAGGLRVLEITLRTPHGLNAIREVRAAMPADVWVGAGTVTDTTAYREAEQAGADFVISPGVTNRLLDYGLTSDVPLLPGIATVSELMMGYELGYRAFKFFPAVVAGGVHALRAMAGPFAEARFCPTGGIRQNTARDFLAEPNVVTVGGTWLTPVQALAAGDWAAIEALTRSSLDDCRP